MKIYHLLLVVIGILMFSCTEKKTPKDNSWTYINIDSTKQMWGNWDDPEWLRYFGLDAGDVNNDGLLDIISGRYIYQNPGGDMTSEWKKVTLDDNVDGILQLDVDGDQFGDIIAQSLPDLIWYEAIDKEGTRYEKRVIGQVPATGHVNSQGFEKTQLIPGGKEEILIAGNGNIYVVVIPAENATTTPWTIKLICENTSDEGIGVGDIDGDGDLDIAAGRRPEGENEPKILMWYENEGSIDNTWKEKKVGESEHPIDRIEVADLDGDKKADIVATEERYPGLEPDAHLYWFKQNSLDDWSRNEIVQQYSMNNLDIVDIDEDGDIDLLTAEHKGKRLELQFWLNDGKGAFSKMPLDTGKENHLGTQLVDLDGDGDLDIIGAGWDQHQYMHVWRNNALKNEKLASASPGSEVTISEANYEDRSHYVVHTKGATYYYDKAGGGFSRVIDRLGNDWINFKMEPWGEYPASAASAFRGLPNLVHKSDKDAGAGHPGHEKCSSVMVNGNKIVTTSKSGFWSWEWTFTDTKAVLEVKKTEEKIPYWFLYEGTPGGRYKASESIYGTDKSGFKNDTPDFYKEGIYFDDFKWAYFGRKGIASTFFMAQITGDTPTDMMSYLGNTKEGADSRDGMVVFGFGRGKNNIPLLTGQTKFVIGMYDGEVEGESDHILLSNHINNLTENLNL